MAQMMGEAHDVGGNRVRFASMAAAPKPANPACNGSNGVKKPKGTM